MSVEARRELRIEAGRPSRQYWSDLWRYRDLFLFLAWRDILVRYKQTAIGIAWSVVRPTLTIAIFTFVFGQLAQLPSDGAPYALIVCAALLPWQLFASAFSEAGNSLVQNANLISKVYFPRMLLPASAVAVSLVDFCISFAILAALMLAYGVVPSARMLAIPGFVLAALLAATGASLWIAALNVRYRDFRHVIPFAVQLGLYISPVGFSSSIVPERWRLLYSLNPMVGAIDGFRWAVLGGGARLDLSGFALSTLASLLVLSGGLWFFRRTERGFADVI
jgi:homopolymeric O-antigen transport system permease protein